MERYYKINENLNKFLESKGVDCKIYKYGVNPSLLKSKTNDNEKIFPYALSNIDNIVQNSWTSKESGYYTQFDYNLNFFASKETEFDNDSDKFIPFEAIKIAFTDISEKVLEIYDGVKNTMIADILNFSSKYNFQLVTGVVLPSASITVKFACVSAYAIESLDVGFATDTSTVLEFQI